MLPQLHRAYQTLKHNVRHYWHRFCRACEFASLGFNDYEGDWIPFIDLIEFKLKKMRDYHARNDWQIEGADKIVKKIDLCLLLIKRIKDDNYWEAAHKRYMSYNSIEHLPFSLYKLYENDAVRVQYIRNVYAFEQNMARQDMELFTKILCKHLKSWWD